MTDIRVGADFSKLLAQAKEANRQLKELIENGKRLEKVSDQFNKAGKRTGRVQREILASGTKLISKWKDVSGVLQVAGFRLEKTTSSISEMTRAEQAAAATADKVTKALEKQSIALTRKGEAARKAAFQQQFPAQIRAGTPLADPRTRRFGDPAELARVESLLARLTRSLKGNQIEALNAKVAFQNYTQQGLAAFNRLSPSVQSNLRLLEAAMKKLKTPADKIRESLKLLAAEGAKLRQIRGIVAVLTAEFKRLGASSDPRKVQQFNAALISLTRTMVKTRLSTQQVLSVWQRLQASGAQAFTTAEGKIVPALQRIQRAMKRTQQASAKASSSMIISWTSVARIVVGGAVHRAFFAITSALRDSIDTAKEFTIAIAEIQTLSTDNTVTTKRWADEVFRLSNEFGKTAQDVAEGVYQTLSNQVAQGAEAIQFMESALKLSLATVSSAEDAVNALTSAINAFGLETIEADRVADQYFKIIELGRVRLSELSNTFGRVLVLASQLGVTFAETGAFIDLATIRGVKANEAMTQLRNVFLKLLRPTDALTARLKEFGVESGAQLVNVGGFVGVMEFLNDVIKKEGVTALSEYFGRVRAITGALQAGGAGLEKFKEDFNKLKDSINSAGEASEKVRDALGTRLQRAIETARNFFTKEFGEKFIRTMLSVIKTVGGVEAVLHRLFSLLGSAAFGVAASLVAVWIHSLKKAGLAVVALRLKAISLGVALKAALSPTGVLILATILAELGQTWLRNWEKAEEAALNYDKKVRKIFADHLAEVKKNRAQTIEEARRAAVESSRVWFKSVANTRKELFRLQKELKARNEEIKEGIRETIDDITDAVNRLVKEPADKIKELTSSIENAQKAIVSIQQKTSGRIFEQSLKDSKDINDTVALISKRIVKLTQESRKSFLEGDVDSAKRNFAESQKLLEKLGTNVRKFNKEREDAENKLAELLNKRTTLSLSLEKKQRDLRAKSRREGDPLTNKLAQRRFQQEVRDTRREQIELTEEIERQRDIIDQSARLTLTTKKVEEARNNLLTIHKRNYEEFIKIQENERKAQEVRLAERKAQTKDFLKLLNEVENIDKFITRQIERGVNATEAGEQATKKLKDAREAAAKLLTSDPQSLNAQIRLIEKFKEKEDLINDEITTRNVERNAKAAERIAKETRDKQVQAFKDAEEQLQENLTVQNQMASRFAALKSNLEAAVAVMKRAGEDGTKFSKQLAEDFTAVSKFNLSRFGEEFASLFTRTGEHLEEGILDAELRLENMASVYEALIVQMGSSEKAVGKHNFELLAGLKLIRTNLKNLQDFKKFNETSKFLADQIERTKNELAGQKEALKGAIEAQKEFQVNFSLLPDALGSVTDDIQKLTAAIKQMNEALAKTTLARTAVPAEPRAKGGLIDFSRRGTDTVPAMLTPGEFVINRRAAQAHLPILRAINSGVRAQRFQTGGEVNNGTTVNVGDVNITNGGNQPVTENDIVKAMRRAWFQGKTKLKM